MDTENTEITYPFVPNEEIFYPAGPFVEYGYNIEGKRIPREHLETLYDEGKISFVQTIESEDGSWFALRLCSIEEMEQRVKNTKNQLRIVTETVKRNRKYHVGYRLEYLQKRRLTRRLDTQIKTLQYMQLKLKGGDDVTN